jgi:hypothetical protein
MIADRSHSMVTRWSSPSWRIGVVAAAAALVLGTTASQAIARSPHCPSRAAVSAAVGGKPVYRTPPLRKPPRGTLACVYSTVADDNTDGTTATFGVFYVPAPTRAAFLSSTLYRELRGELQPVGSPPQAFEFGIWQLAKGVGCIAFFPSGDLTYSHWKAILKAAVRTA